MKIKKNDIEGLACPVESGQGGLFLSLVDYRNNYFTSDNINKIIEFYNGFRDRDQLLEWMKERPKGVPVIHEIEGDKDFIVVIPTGNIRGKYAQNCKDKIFKGQQLIFVGSGGKGDFYFNYPHYVNAGIKRAMEYNPKWVVLSNDDVYEISKIEILKKELSKKDPNEFYVLFAKEIPYITQDSKLAERRFIFKVILPLATKNFKWNKFERKFKIRYLGAPTKGLISILYKNGRTFRNFIAFSIFSINLCNKLNGNILDETYINAAEDTDLSLKASTEYRSEIINFEIGAFKGKTIGTGKIRRFREIPSNAYLNYKIETGQLKT